VEDGVLGSVGLNRCKPTWSGWPRPGCFRN